MTLLLNFKNLSKNYGPRTLFRGLSISFDDTERTGLIGPNGSGKSTLLKIMAGIEAGDGGTVESRRGLRLGYVPQEDSFPAGVTVQEAVVGALDDQHLDEHEKDVRAGVVLGRIGFADFAQKVETLSGGWRKRLALARELTRQPDLLVLDEPTNHLDLAGILWLEELLGGAPFAFVLVSHDRYLLEGVCNRVVDLSPAYADGYLSVNGTYSDFLEKREEYLAAQQRNQQSLASRVRREVEWLRRGAKARTTKAKGRIEQAGRMMQDLAELRTRNAQAGTVEIDFDATNRQTRKLLAAKGISKTLGGRTLFKGLDLVLSPGTKLGLLGPNGSGKSTLIRVLAGEAQPDAGTVTAAEGLRTVLFDQGREQLDPAATLRRALSPSGDSVAYRGGSMHISAWAKQFLFRTEQLDLPVGELSGGEQSRTLIARLMLKPADLLILDEPTNDLDIPSLEVLEESLQEFAGALVLVTHDRHMLDRVSNQVLALDGEGGFGFYADYAQWQTAQDARAVREQEAAAAARAKAQKDAARPPMAAPVKVKLTWKEQRELEQIEERIVAAESEAEAAQKQMEEPAVIADHVKLRECCERADGAQNLVKDLYARWQELEAKRDGASG